MIVEETSLPYVHRKQLDFEAGVAFALVVKSQSDEAVAVTVRGMTKAGPFVFQHTPTADFAVKTEVFRIPDIPIWVSIVSETGDGGLGKTFVIVNLTINGENSYALTSGYVHEAQSISWPANDLKDAAPIKGKKVIVVSADPAANTELNAPVPDNVMWKILGIQFNLVTDANAADRRVHLNFGTETVPVIECIAGTTQAASLTRSYSAHPIGAGGALSDDNDIIIPIPDNLILVPADTIQTLTVNRQATDNFGTMKIWVERYYRPL